MKIVSLRICIQSEATEKKQRTETIFRKVEDAHNKWKLMCGKWNPSWALFNFARAYFVVCGIERARNGDKWNCKNHSRARKQKKIGYFAWNKNKWNTTKITCNANNKRRALGVGVGVHIQNDTKPQTFNEVYSAVMLRATVKFKLQLSLLYTECSLLHFLGILALVLHTEPTECQNIFRNFAFQVSTIREKSLWVFAANILPKTK